MSIRDLFRREAQRFLLPDEEIQAVLSGITIPHWRIYIFSTLALPPDSHRAVVFTNRRVLLCRQGLRNLHTTLEEIIENVARENRRIGPPRGVLSMKLDLFSTPIFVSRRFFKDIVAADAALDN